MRIAVLILLLAACGCGRATRATGIPEYGYEVVHTYPHDPQAFTEGLFYLNGFLYESTGLNGQSTLRKERLETGEVVQKIDLPSQYFGEGIINWNNRLIQLTYKAEMGFVYDLASFAVKSSFTYPGEGWALTRDNKHIYMSDGTPQIRVLDPGTLKQAGKITVTDENGPVQNVNELEWVKGQIYANIWMTDRIARIDPATGKVVGWIDLTGLLSPSDQIGGEDGTDVLNGIAYDAQHDRLFVTGKRWPKLFQIRLVKKSDQR